MNNGTENGAGAFWKSAVQRIESAREQAPAWLRLMLIVAIPVALLSFLSPKLVDYARERSDSWLKYARHLAAPASSPVLQHPEDLDIAVTERLDSQLAEIRNSAHYHLIVSKNFFSYQFMTLTVATFAAIIAGVLLMPISWAGWKSAPTGLTTSFLLIAAIGILATVLGQVYRQQQNVEDNLSLYYGYLNLEDEFMSYYPVRLADNSSVAPPHKFIQAVDKRIAKLRGFSVTFDSSKIPTAREVYDQLNVPLAEQAPKP